MMAAALPGLTPMFQAGRRRKGKGIIGLFLSQENKCLQAFLEVSLGWRCLQSQVSVMSHAHPEIEGGHCKRSYGWRWEAMVSALWKKQDNAALTGALCTCVLWHWWWELEGRGDTFLTPEGKSLNTFVTPENVTEASQHTLRQSLYFFTLVSKYPSSSRNRVILWTLAICYWPLTNFQIRGQ